MKDKKLLDKRAPFVPAGCICSRIWGIALQASSQGWLPVIDLDLGRATKFGERRSARSGSTRVVPQFDYLHFVVLYFQHLAQHVGIQRCEQCQEQGGEWSPQSTNDGVY